MCNKTKNETCAPYEEIQRTMPSGYIGIYFPDSIVNPSNYDSPGQGIPREVFTNYDLNFNKELDLFVKNNYIIDENGLIFTNYKQQKVVSVDSTMEFDFYSQKDDFFYLYLKVEQKVAIFNRTYLKLQNLLAQIGGLLNVFWFVFALINETYSKLILIREVIFDAFHIKTISHNDQEKKKELESDKGEKQADPGNLDKNKEEKKKDRFVDFQLITQNDLNQKLKKKINIEIMSMIPKKDTPFKSILSPKSMKTKFTNQPSLSRNPSKESTFKKSPNFKAKTMTTTFREIPKADYLKIDEINSPVFKKPEPKSLSVKDIEDIHYSQEFFGEKSKILKETPQITKRSNDDNLLIVNPSEVKKVIMGDSQEESNFTSFHLSFLDYIYIYTGFWKTPERQLKAVALEKGRTIMTKCLDIRYIIQKIYEIEKLKWLLLSEDQLEMFNLLPKPEIDLILNETENLTAITRVLNRRLTKTKEEENKESSKMIHSKKHKLTNLTEIDKKLLMHFRTKSV